MKNKKTIITYGTYDMLHIGHMNLLRRAKALGDYLIVGVTDENYDRSRGKLNVVESTKRRVKAIEALDFVDKVIVETHKNQKAEDMVKYDVDIFAIGDDWIGAFDYLNKYTHVEYLARTEGISSTKLRKENFNIIKMGIVGLGRDTQAFINESEFVSNLKVNRIFAEDFLLVKAFTKDNKLIRYGHDNYEEFLDTAIQAVYIDTHLSEHYKSYTTSTNSSGTIFCLSSTNLATLRSLRSAMISTGSATSTPTGTLNCCSFSSITVATKILCVCSEYLRVTITCLRSSPAGPTSVCSNALEASSVLALASNLS